MSARLLEVALWSAVSISVVAPLGAFMTAAPAAARDGSGGGGSSGGGSSGSGSSQGGSSGGGSSGSSSQGSSGGTGSGSSSIGGSQGEGGSGRDGSGHEGSGRDGSGSSTATSDGSGHHDRGERGSDDSPSRDHDIARDAVLRGGAVPLAKLIPTVRARMAGDVLDVKVRRLTSGLLVYDVTVLSATGEYRSITIDAKRNRIIEAGQR